MVVETRDRRGTAAELIIRLGADMTVDDAVRTPFLLIGTVEEMAEQLRRTRQRYGFSYVTVHEPYMEAFAPVIERYGHDRCRGLSVIPRCTDRRPC
jgi:alkanesulfonate monooxygenase SsuD/methylene tetrahydromethanopterin reductase-like flavin-dependent oxidoreductase (luciferase family)